MTTMFIINKNDLAKKVQQEIGCSGHDCKKIVSDVFDAIIDGLAHDQEVSINGFGKFQTRTRAARMGINLSTKEKIEIPSTKTVAFKPSSTMKKSVNE